MAFRPLVALDVGSTKVACAIGLSKQESDPPAMPFRTGPELSRRARWDLLGSSVVAYPGPMDGWLSDPLIVSQAIEQALESTGVAGVFHAASVAISHPLLQSECVRATVHIADEPVAVRMRDVNRLRAVALDQALGIDREPLLVELLGCDGNGFEGVRDPRGLPATRLRGTFRIVTMPLAARRLVTQAVESAGLHLSKLTYTLTAAWSSLGEEVARERVLFIDAGGLMTDIGLIDEGVLHASATIQAGGATLADAIAKELSVTMEQASAWSLEGTACRKPEVRSRIEQYRQAVQETVGTILKDQPRPDLAVVGGRGALVDGFAEWIEQACRMRTMLCRSERTRHLRDVSLQVGASPAIGLLEASLRVPGAPPGPSHRLGRLLEQTKLILTEYF